jgi:transcriptional regulator with XRE-family HTH domain
MTAAEMVRKLCKKEDISISELARRIGQSPQNLNKKLQRDTLSLDEMHAIAEAVDATYTYSQEFTFEDGEVIEIGNKESL